MLTVGAVGRALRDVPTVVGALAEQAAHTTMTNTHAVDPHNRRDTRPRFFGGSDRINASKLVCLAGLSAEVLADERL